MRTDQGVVGRRHYTSKSDVDLLSMERGMPSPASGLSRETADGVRTATIIDGRGRAGKTTVANVLVQFCRGRGADLRVWNADRQNETHSLSVFHPDAIRPPSDDPDDKGVCLRSRSTRRCTSDSIPFSTWRAVIRLCGSSPAKRNSSPRWRGVGSELCFGRCLARMLRTSII
jgi:hypothetical protein